MQVRKFTNRRGFLKLTALGVAGGAILAACAPAAPPTPTPAPKPVATAPTPTPAPAEAAKPAAQPTPTSAPAAQPKPAAGAKATLRVSHSWDAVFWKRQVEFDEQFMKKHSDIEIKGENVVWAEWVKKLTTEAAAGTSPDVQYCQFANARKFILDGVFTNLRPYYGAQKDFDLEDFTPTSTTTYKYKGDLYIIPYDEGPLIIFFNKDMFDEYGIPYPKPDWTMEDLFQTAQKLTRGEGVKKTFGYLGGLANFGGESNPNFYYPFGAAFVDPDEAKVLLDTPEAEKALQWWVDFRLKAKVNPTPADTQTVQGNFFAFGKVGMMLSGSWSTPWLAEQAKFKWDVAHWPKGPARHTTSTMGSGYGITKDSKSRDQSWVYENEYLNAEGQSFMWGITGRGSPSRKKAWEAYWKSPVAPPSAKVILDALTTYANHDILQSPNGAEITRTANPTHDLILLGQMSVKDAIKKIAKDLEPVVKKNEEYKGLFG